MCMYLGSIVVLAVVVVVRAGGALCGVSEWVVALWVRLREATGWHLFVHDELYAANQCNTVLTRISSHEAPH